MQDIIKQWPILSLLPIVHNRCRSTYNNPNANIFADENSLCIGK